jgi:hypothetical protein
MHLLFAQNVQKIKDSPGRRHDKVVNYLCVINAGMDVIMARSIGEIFHPFVGKTKSLIFFLININIQIILCVSRLIIYTDI